MIFENKDYVVFNGGKKPLLGIISSIKGSVHTVIVDDNTRGTDNEKIVDIDRKDIYANLGKNPVRGVKVNGLPIEPFVKTIEFKGLGNLDIYRDMTETEQDLFFRNVKNMGKWMKRCGITEHLPLNMEIRDPKGMRAGSYHHSRKEDVPDKIVWHPISIADLPYVTKHELGHHIWFNYLSDTDKAEWVLLYKKSKEIEDISVEKLNGYREDLVSQGSVRDMKSSLDEEDIIFDMILSYIFKVHHLNRKHLDLLLKAGNSLKSYWPKFNQQLTNNAVFISEYAGVSPEETYSEAFAFTTTGRELPKVARKKLIRQAKAINLELQI